MGSSTFHHKNPGGDQIGVTWLIWNDEHFGLLKYKNILEIVYRWHMDW